MKRNSSCLKRYVLRIYLSQPEALYNEFAFPFISQFGTMRLYEIK